MVSRYQSDGVDPNEPLCKNCRQCGKEFCATNRRQVYCSEKCRNYFNNNKGVKSRTPFERMEAANKGIVQRMLQAEKCAEFTFEQLKGHGFKFGLPGQVFKASDGWLWTEFDGYCVSQRGEDEFYVSIGSRDSFELKPKGSGYFKLLS